MRTSKFMKEEYKKKNIKNILYLDLETKMAPRGSAEWGMIYCYVARLRNLEKNIITEYYDWRFPEYKKNMKISKIEPYYNDLPLLQQISYLLHKSDIVFAHAGLWFDYPYFRTRCLSNHAKDLVPNYRSIRYGDTWKMTKKSFKLMSNSLENVSRALFENKKTQIHPMIWESIASHNMDAMIECLNHCRKDVYMLEKLHFNLEDFNPIPCTFL